MDIFQSLNDGSNFNNIMSNRINKANNIANKYVFLEGFNTNITSTTIQRQNDKIGTKISNIQDDVALSQQASSVTNTKSKDAWDEYYDILKRMPKGIVFVDTKNEIAKQKIPQYQGCFKDKRNRAISNEQAITAYGKKGGERDLNVTGGDATIKECAKRASDLGESVFALQNKGSKGWGSPRGQCYVGGTLENAKKHGKSSKCRTFNRKKQRYGGHTRANAVYTIGNQYGAPSPETICNTNLYSKFKYKGTGHYCIKAIGKQPKDKYGCRISRRPDKCKSGRRRRRRRSGFENRITIHEGGINDLINSISNTITGMLGLNNTGYENYEDDDDDITIDGSLESFKEGGRNRKKKKKSSIKKLFRKKKKKKSKKKKKDWRD